MHQSSSKTRKFIRKLDDILQNQKLNHILRWTCNGQGIQIVNRKQFQNSVLEQYFKLKKITSFLRQLHLYGFYKNKSIKTGNVFQNRLFTRDNKQNIDLIKRVYKKKEGRKPIQVSQTSVSSFEKQQQIKLQFVPAIYNSSLNFITSPNRDEQSLMDWLIEKQHSNSWLLGEDLQ